MPAARRRPPAIRLDFRSGLPAYLQIVRQVRRLRATGMLRPGERLPTVRELAGELGLNFNTVARAYRLLDRGGVVSAQQGRGTFMLTNRNSGREKRIALQTLTAQYIAEARRQSFSEAEIAASITSRLRLRLASKGAGDNHG